MRADMSAPRKVLLDTNVWLDAFDGMRPGSASACELMERCVATGADLLYAVASAKDVFYLVSATLKRRVRSEGRDMTEAGARAIASYASACVDTMAEVGVAVGADESDVWLARRLLRIHADFEDCLVLAAAERAGADLLVTNDEGLLLHAPVAALSVVDALALLGRPNGA